MKQLVIAFFLIVTILHAQSLEVPDRMDFAGMKLRIDFRAKKEIQEVVDQLLFNETYYNKKVQQIDLYFPIIEQLFKEENVPDDFKYLIIQESNFQADAVSSSNAVGYWQFKTATAQEVGLRVDRTIDERKSLAASTRGAAEYLKRNNREFDNWVYTLMAYNTGLTGALSFAEDKNYGAKTMDIDKNTHWYVKKFLAHKIAYQESIGSGNPTEPIRLELYPNGAGKTLGELASNYDVPEDSMYFYNQWIKRGAIPDDKQYEVVIPIYRSRISIIEKPSIGLDHSKKEIEPVAIPMRKSDNPLLIQANKLPAVIATAKDNWESLAIRADIDLFKLLKYNDVTYLDKPESGQVYYLKRKRNKARVYYHTVSNGESLWEISQKYGVKLKRLMVKNRLERENNPIPGTVLWMRFIRPDHIPQEVKNVPKEVPKEVLIGEQYIEDNPEIATVIEDSSFYSFEATSEKYDSENTEEEFELLEEENTIQDSVEMTVSKEKNPAKPPEPKFEMDGIWKVYTVESGDTFFGIGRKFDVQVDSILIWNELTAANPLVIGQQIKIKDNVYDKSIENTLEHRVAPRETLYQISRRYDVTIKQVMDENNLEGFDVQEGQILKIPKNQIDR